MKANNPQGIVRVSEDSEEKRMLAQRVKQAIEETGLSPAEVSRRIGVSRTTITLWSQGVVRSIRSKNALALAKLANVNLEWLVSGVGNKYPGEPGEKTPPASEGSMELQYVSDRERDLLQVFRVLPDAAKDMLIATGRAFESQVESTKQQKVVAINKKSVK